jgi:hypothetical protein
MLARSGKQKQLSPHESKLRNILTNTNPDYDNRADMDSFVMVLRGFSKPLRDSILKMGDAKFFIKRYCNEHFINDCISPAIDSIVQANGGEYIDINAEMVGMPATVEFYMDYCHTTPYGNRFIAEQLAGKMDVFLQKKIDKR